VDIIATQRQERAAALKLALNAADHGDYDTSRRILNGTHGTPQKYRRSNDIVPILGVCDVMPSAEYTPEMMPANLSRVYYDSITQLWFYGTEDVTKSFNITAKQTTEIKRLTRYKTVRIFKCGGETGAVTELAKKLGKSQNAVALSSDFKYVGAILGGKINRRSKEN